MPKITRILVIDDEQAICSICKNYLANRSDIVIIGDCGNIDDAEILIKATKPDVIILDINLIGGTGFDLLKRFPNPNFKVIFITISSEYALTAIKAGALDYIMKPIEEEELFNAIDKVASQSSTTQVQLEMASDFLAGKPERLVVRTSEAIHIVNFNELVFCQSDKGYTTFFLADKTEILVARPLKDFELLLPPKTFVRTHQSFVVNINFVHQIRKDLTLILKNRKEVPISFRKKEEIIKILDK